MPKLTFVSLILSLTFIVGCQVTQRPTASATPTAAVVAANTIPAVSTEEPTLESVKTAVVTATLTALPLPTETTVPTLLPTNTPTPEPVWHIFFSGAPCITSTTCDSNLFMGTESEDYTINSDGSGFMPIADLPGMPTDINFVQFSPDGSQMAYTQYQDETRTNQVIHLLNLDGSSPIELGIQPPDWADTQFLPERDCLAIFRRAGREDPKPEAETLIIEKWCINQPPQLLEIVKFPELYAGSGYTHGAFKLSPDGNYLSGYSQEHGGNMALYLHKIGETTPPILLFQVPDLQPYFSPNNRWWPDNQTIEFIAYYPTTTFYTLNWLKNKIDVQFSGVKIDIPIVGDWSPNGNKFIYASSGADAKPAQSGLYVIDLESGENYQLLDKFYATTVQTWNPTQLPNFLGGHNEK